MNFARKLSKPIIVNTSFLINKRYFRTLYNQTKAHSSKVLHKENIPPVALMIGCIALGFQVFVLYPWHEELSHQFNQLETSTKLLEYISNQLNIKMDKVLELEEEVKAKERKVLEKEEEILQIEKNILSLANELNIKMDHVVKAEEEVKLEKNRLLLK
uniref:Uncharacterized protein n=1 Tax=Chromulina nebulosa TaxID=96789 RepID=A0A6T5VD33_9STRA|mmetsp:Transcript_1647/g.1471  ORF Transcript_1647/g.1471 Transcript_1647/m.1471 type:complete len:158 (+) Transcript_1647:41-514(+)